MYSEATNEFVARGHAVRGEVRIPVTVTGSYPRWKADPVEAKVLVDEGVSPAALGDAFGNDWRLQVEGKTERGRDIWIPSLLMTSSRPTGEQICYEGVCEIFVEGDLEDFDSSGGSFSCSAVVPPTPLAHSRSSTFIRHYDGTITLEGDDREGIKWETELGEAELIDGYTYDSERVGLNEATVRIRQCQVVIKTEFEGNVSLRSFARSLEDALDEPLWLMSLLSRRRLPWYAATIWFFRPEDDFFRTAEIRRQQWLGRDPGGYGKKLSWLDLLADREALVSGHFQRMYSRYEESPHKETIRQVIPFVLSARETGYIEAKLGLVYSALEALVNGLDKGYLLGSNRFKRLRKKLEQVIRGEIEESSLADAVIKKLPELRRESYKDRLLRLFHEHGLDFVSRLWPGGVNIDSEVRALVNRRNVFVHEGAIADYHPYMGDMYRILNLVELWLLKLLRYPGSEINWRGITSDYPINRA
jgi:hypothetical protein